MTNGFDPTQQAEEAPKKESRPGPWFLSLPPHQAYFVLKGFNPVTLTDAGVEGALPTRLVVHTLPYGSDKERNDFRAQFKEQGVDMDVVAPENAVLGWVQLKKYFKYGSTQWNKDRGKKHGVSLSLADALKDTGWEEMWAIETLPGAELKEPLIDVVPPPREGEEALAPDAIIDFRLWNSDDEFFLTIIKIATSPGDTERVAQEQEKTTEEGKKRRATRKKPPKES